MKNMLKLMNMTCRSAISQIILLFLCVLLAEGTWLFAIKKYRTLILS